MVASLSFEPLADDETTHTFESTSIDLPTENKLYVLGFRRNPLGSVDGGLKEIGFSGTLEDDKLCIMPVESEGGQNIKDPFAVIWLSPGYKVMIIPAEGSKIYYQRALNDNIRWTRIKNGWGFDLADPLFTALDGAIHVKFDTRPDKRRRVWFQTKLKKYVTRRKEHTAVVKHIEAGELEGVEEHEQKRVYQIAAKVSVSWGKNMDSESPEPAGVLNGFGRARSSPSIMSMNCKDNTEVSENLSTGEKIQYLWGYDSDAETLHDSDTRRVNSDAEPDDAAGLALQGSTASQHEATYAPMAPLEGGDYTIAIQQQHNQIQISNISEAGLADFSSSDEEENGYLMTPRAGPIAPSKIKRSSSHHLITPGQGSLNIEKQASFYNDSTV